MPFTNQTTDFWGWYNRHNTRFEYSHFQNAGIDQFTSGPNQDPNKFYDILNLLPAMSGGFRRRWGSSLVTSYSTSIQPINPVRFFSYNAFQDQTDISGTTNRNLFIFTDDTNFLVMNDDGTTYTGPNLPTWPGSPAATTSPNFVGAVTRS